MQLTSTLTCPECGGVATETMPTNACQFFYDCRHCAAVLRPLAGDCCVFCSLALPQGSCARQRFLGHKRNIGYATRFNRAIGSLSGWNSPAGSRLACSQR